MKLQYLIPSLLGLAIIITCLYLPDTDKSTTYPVAGETIVLEKNEAEEVREQSERDAFFEKMHRTAPGVDWKAIDHDTRFKKYLQKIATSSLRTTTAQDTFANGYLLGTWKERGSRNQSGRIVYVDIDSLTNDVYCASAGGIVWKGDLTGSSWTPLNDQMRFRGIIYLKKIHNVSSPDRLISAASKYIYFSDDDGQSWSVSSGLTNVVGWGGIKRVMQLSDANKTVIALVQEWDFTNWNQINSIYKSTDQGSTFVKMFEFDEPTFGNSDKFSLYIPYHDRDNVYLLNDTTLYSIDKNNNTYSVLSTFPVVSHGRVMLTGSKGFGTHYMYAYVDAYIYRSTDAGQTWNYVAQLAKNPFSRNSFSTSILDPSKVYFGDIECWVSNVGGQTWNKVNNWFDYYNSPSNKLHADIPAIISLVDANGVELTFVCTDGGLYVSNNQLNAVTNISYRHLNVSQYYSVYTHKNQTDYIYAGSQDQGFQRCTADSGTVLGFDQLISGDYGHIVSSNRGESIWTVYPGFADYYADAKNSNHTKGWNFNGANDLWLPPLMEDPLSPSNVYLAGGALNAGSGSHMIKLSYSSASNTITATQLSYDFSVNSGGVISAMSYSPIELRNWYVATDNGKFFHSTDSGSTWTMTSAFTGPAAHYFYGSSIHPSQRNPGTLFLAGSGYSNAPVFRSDDHGQTFYSISTGLPATLVYDIVGTNDDSLLFAATEAGPYVYVMRDDQWYDLAKNSAPDQTYWSVEYVQLINTIRFGTYGRGIWDFEIQNIYVGLPKADNNLSLISVFPNPVENVVNVDLSRISTTSSIRVYTISGQKLIERNAEALKQEHIDMSKLPGGLYIIEVLAGTNRFSQKIIKL